MRNAVGIGDRGGDEVGVALGSDRRRGRREPASRAAWLASRVQRRARPVRRGSLPATLPRALSSFCSRISSPTSWQISWLLSSPPFWEPSSRPCLAVFFDALPAFFTARFALGRPLLGGALLRGLLAGARGRRFADLLRLALFRSFLSSLRHHEFLFNSTISGIIVRRSVTASLPRASQTPRKPAVFAPDYRIRCRARRGRSFPIPQPAVQGGADSHWRRQRAAFRRSSDRCRR